MDPSFVGDRSNWRASPHSRWAFRNVAALLPTARIAASSNVRALGVVADGRLDGFSLNTPHGELSLEAFLALTATDGFVVLKDGAIVCERYDHGLTAGQIHIAMSASKSLTGLVAGLLAADGHLDLAAPVERYLPELAPTAYGAVAIQALLDMRSGVVFDEAQLAAYAAATNWEVEVAEEGLHGFYRGLDAPNAGPDGPFRYLSPNTDLLGWVIERASGQSFAELMSQRLWRRLGAETDAAITLDAAGAPRCTGGLCVTARDLARLGQLIVDGGRIGDDQVVPSAWIEDTLHGGDPSAWSEGEWGKMFGFAGSSLHYRNGWYVVRDQPGLMFAMGIHGQNLFVDIPRRLVVVKLSSLASPIDYRALPLTHRAVAEIQRRLG